MHAVIEDVLHRFEKFPEAHVEHDDTSITYLPTADHGYPVRLAVGRDGWFTVYHSRCWENFSGERDAVRSFALGLSSAFRIKEFILFGRPTYWELEVQDFPFEKWVAIWSESLPLGWLLPFTSSPTVRILQNRLIELDACGGGCAGSTE